MITLLDEEKSYSNDELKGKINDLVLVVTKITSKINELIDDVNDVQDNLDDLEYEQGLD